MIMKDISKLSHEEKMAEHMRALKTFRKLGIMVDVSIARMKENPKMVIPIAEGMIQALWEIDRAKPEEMESLLSDIKQREWYQLQYRLTPRECPWTKLFAKEK